VDVLMLIPPSSICLFLMIWVPG